MLFQLAQEIVSIGSFLASAPSKGIFIGRETKCARKYFDKLRFMVSPQRANLVSRPMKMPLKGAEAKNEPIDTISLGQLKQH